MERTNNFFYFYDRKGNLVIFVFKVEWISVVSMEDENWKVCESSCCSICGAFWVLAASVPDSPRSRVRVRADCRGARQASPELAGQLVGEEGRVDQEGRPESPAQQGRRVATLKGKAFWTSIFVQPFFQNSYDHR
jgi:hypothetical protein